jgi:hypothetical protein
MMSIHLFCLFVDDDWWWWFIILRPAQEYFTYMETSPLPGRAVYRATPAVTRDLGFSRLIRRAAPFSRLLRLARGCGGPILTQILTGGLFVCLFVSSRTNNFSAIWRLSPLPVQGCKFRPMLGTQALWAGRGLYRATPTVTRGLGLYGLIRKTGTYVP